MSYLDRLKAHISENAYPTLPTKPTKAPSVSLVGTPGCHVLQNAPRVVSHDATLLESFEERAAIIEYNGGIPRADAEHLAWACVRGKEEIWT